MIAGSACAACMQHFWSNQRLQQHLAYQPRDGRGNPCYNYLKATGYEVTYEAERLPRYLDGLHRRESLPASGPQPCRAHHLDAEIQALDSAIDRAWRETLIDRPEHHEEQAAKLGDILTGITLRWFKRFTEDQPSPAQAAEDLGDLWISTLAELPPSFHHWAEEIFTLWSHHWLPDLTATFTDGLAEHIVEDALAGVSRDLSLAAARDRLQQFLRQREDLRCQQDQPLPPHRPVRQPGAVCGRAGIDQAVPRLLSQQVEWQQFLRSVSFEDLPTMQGLPYFLDSTGQRCIILIHLFSGRRRSGDFHSHVRQWSRNSAFRIFLLSLDTAVSVSQGNLSLSSPAWGKVLALYQQGAVGGTLSGPPCETFSEARFHEVEGHPGPRPLRSHDRPFGLDGLTLRELAQLGAGSEFGLQTLWTLGYHMIFGGIFTAEHPAVPRDPSRPSIWRLALTECLRQHPDAVLDYIEQYKWGAAAVKPTHLLHFGLPHFRRDLWATASSSCPRPTQGAIGRCSTTGTYRTAAHKEYPIELNQGLALTFTKQIEHLERTHQLREVSCPAPALYSWLVEMDRLSGVVRESAPWLPDYQPSS